MSRGINRSDFLKAAAAVIGGVASLPILNAIAKNGSNFDQTIQPHFGAFTVNKPSQDQAESELIKNPATYKEFFNDMMTSAEKVGGIWAYPEVGSTPVAAFAPYLPATQDEVITRAKKVEVEKGTGIGWGEAVFPRVIMLPSDHPLDHVKDSYDAIKALGEKRSWGDITAWEGAWVYSMTLMGGLKDIQANNQVQVMSNGKMVDIDPVRLDNDAIAMSVIDRGNPKMAVYVVPQNGEIHARLPQDSTESNVTMAFSVNQYHKNIKTEASEDDIPAIIVRGVATAPVTISYCVPIDNQGNFKTSVIQTRLEPLTGNVTVDMDFPAEDYYGDISPFVTINMPVVATSPEGETEVIFVPGSDVRLGNPKYAEKHRVTIDMLKGGQAL